MTGILCSGRVCLHCNLLSEAEGEWTVVWQWHWCGVWDGHVTASRQTAVDCCSITLLHTCQ